MATSPNTSTVGTPKKKEESFLEKIGTLGRKKKLKEGIASKNSTIDEKLTILLCFQIW